MIGKTVLVLCVVSAFVNAAPQAARYPAGVDPHTCPNYPNCDNVALAARATGAAPYAAPSYSAYGHNSGVPGAAAALPAGVDARACPNYPYCGPTPVAVPSPHNSWSAPAAYNQYSAPAAPQQWSAPAAPQQWSAPAAPQQWTAPAPAQGGAQYPAGVDPHACPNYPYCS